MNFLETLLIAATKQLYEWFSPSVHLSISHLFHYVPTIVSSWNFQELLPMADVRSVQKVMVRGQRSRLQRSNPIKPSLDRNSSLNLNMDEIMHKAWCCLGEVLYCFSCLSIKFQSHTAQKIDFDPNWVHLDCNSNLNLPMTTKWCTKLEVT